MFIRWRTYQGQRGHVKGDKCFMQPVLMSPPTDRRLPFLKSINAPVRFVSCEPLLEPVRLDLTWIRWLIVGGESGPNRRPFDKAWAAALERQCDESRVAFFFKQGSARYQGGDDLLEGQSFKSWPA